MLLPPRSAARLLALDTGTNCGWAVNLSDQIVSNCAKLATNPRGKRWRDLRSLLDSLATRFGPFDAVFYERSEFIGGGNQALAILDRGGCYAVLEAWAWSRDIPLRFGRTNQVKKALTGSGRAEKADMIAHASQVAGRTIANHNEADSIGVLVFGLDAWRAECATSAA